MIKSNIKTNRIQSTQSIHAKSACQEAYQSKEKEMEKPKPAESRERKENAKSKQDKLLFSFRFVSLVVVITLKKFSVEPLLIVPYLIST